MQRIAIDMDEVTADTMAHYLSLYNAEFKLNLTKKHFDGRDVFEAIDRKHVARAREYFQEESFFAGIPVMDGSPEVIRDLMKRYEVFITTAAMDVPCSFSAKFHWLKKHLPFIPSSNIVFCGDKSIVAADFMIDDDARHLRRFLGEGILYTAPHNIHENAFRRVDNWQQVRELFLS